MEGQQINSRAQRPAWVRRAATVAASFFLLWHSAATVLAPAPASYLKGLVYPLFEPYITLFHLDGQWAFFAPEPAAGQLVRYLLKDAAGRSREYRLTEDLRRAHPAFFRHTTLLSSITPDKPAFVASMAGFLCRRHADLKPHRLTFLLREQLRLSPESYLQGHRPLDEDYIRVRALPPVRCTNDR
jgi:hypothetical protein